MQNRKTTLARIQKELSLVKISVLAAAALVVGMTAASAQPGNQSLAAHPANGMGSKTMASCIQDIHKYCASTPIAIQNECLVKNWNFIANDCQDALGIPGGDDTEALAAATGHVKKN